MVSKAFWSKIVLTEAHGQNMPAANMETWQYSGATIYLRRFATQLQFRQTNNIRQQSKLSTFISFTSIGAGRKTEYYHITNTITVHSLSNLRRDWKPALSQSILKCALKEPHRTYVALSHLWHSSSSCQLHFDCRAKRQWRMAFNNIPAIYSKRIYRLTTQQDRKLQQVIAGIFKFSSFIMGQSIMTSKLYLQFALIQSTKSLVNFLSRTTQFIR